MRKLYAMAVFAGVLLVGCSNTREEAREEASRTGEAAREAGQDVSAAAKRDREEFQRRTEARLDEFGRKIDEMQTKAKNATGAAKAKWDREVAELEDERRAARAKYNEMKNSADNNWESFKDEVSRSVDKVESVYNRVLEKMKTDGK